MKQVIVHLSDIHYRNNWEENHGVVFKELFKDLTAQLDGILPEKRYLVFSGDIVQAGSEKEQYSGFKEKFDKELNNLGIIKERRICVPGNHDISTAAILSKRVDHEGVISQGLNETEVNDYFANPSSVFISKFEQYKKFENDFAELGTLNNSLSGSGFDLGDDVGIYCLNSALFSCGGLKGKGGEILSDKNKLVVGTRGLHAWLGSNNARWKILVMHHPLNWLTPWAEEELKTLISKDFILSLSGHAHNQETIRSINNGNSIIWVSAPALFTNKIDDLGYSLIAINSETGVADITFRQWTKHRTFRPGVNFSDTDDGKITISLKDYSPDRLKCEIDVNLELVSKYLFDQLKKSLASYTSLPTMWVDPILSKNDQCKTNNEPTETVTIESLLENPTSVIIKAPPQFGLTCLARHLSLTAWRSSKRSFWLYLDSKQMKHTKSKIHQAVNEELQSVGLKQEDVKCVLLDSWSINVKEAGNLLENLCDFFDGIPIIVMQTLDHSFLVNTVSLTNISRSFGSLYLCSLTREKVRHVVSEYNHIRHVGDEDIITKKIVTDMETLNIHRTPLNCLTLLKVSEFNFDESPVNRAEMLNRVLFLLFNLDELPSYKSRPDLKDCEFILGYFCELMLRESELTFSRKKFLTVLRGFCDERVMDIDVDVVFDILYQNNILVNYGEIFCFKASYWVYYFAAQRMHHERQFADFVFSENRYANYPAVIEFYTGIDRQRGDALRVLADDLKVNLKKVQDKCGLPEDLNPYQFLQWTPSQQTMELMEEEVRNGVEESNLPTVIKDNYADRSYDQKKPYYQEIANILTEHSLVYMMESVRASCRALRNSDFVEPEIKRELLKEILNCWHQLSKVMLVLMPPLAEEGHVAFEGVLFMLIGKFGETPEERMWSILSQIPNNVVHWYEDDLFSQKLGPLLIERFMEETDAIKRHEMALLLAMHRPRGWKERIAEYVSSSAKNSFYLFDIDRTMRTQYRYGFSSPTDTKDLAYLIKMVSVKHTYGSKKPGPKAIGKTPDSVLPRKD